MNNSFHTPPLHWTKGPRVRVDSLRAGDVFLAYDGRWYEYVRKDGALSATTTPSSPAARRSCSSLP